MAFESLTFTDGEILYANSHMNPLQANFTALATQEAGAPKIDVSCSNSDLFQSDVASINTLVVSDFNCGIATIDSATITNFELGGTLAAETIVTSDLQSDIASFNTLTTSLFTANSGSIGAIAVNSDMDYIGKPFFACRAWVNFNGQGVVAINGSGNVTSITDLNVGNYRVNLTTAMEDDNYAHHITFNPTNVGLIGDEQVAKTTTAIEMRLYNWNGLAAGNATLSDMEDVNVTVFR
jgi:hypothetical protein